jgi:hypothetical protein
LGGFSEGCQTRFTDRVNVLDGPCTVSVLPSPREMILVTVPVMVKTSTALGTVMDAEDWPSWPGASVVIEDDVEPVTPFRLVHVNVACTVILVVPVLVSSQNKPSVVPLTDVVRPGRVALHPTLLSARLDPGNEGLSVNAGRTRTAPPWPEGLETAKEADEIWIVEGSSDAQQLFSTKLKFSIETGALASTRTLPCRTTAQ